MIEDTTAAVLLLHTHTQQTAVETCASETEAALLNTETVGAADSAASVVATSVPSHTIVDLAATSAVDTLTLFGTTMQAIHEDTDDEMVEPLGSWVAP